MTKVNKRISVDGITDRDVAVMVIMSDKMTDEQKLDYLTLTLGYNLIEALELVMEVGFKQDRIGA